MKDKEFNSKKDGVSAFDKLQPMISEKESKRLGLDHDEVITEMKEFRKELMMDNFPQAKEKNGPVRRLSLKHGNHSRGVFNVWMTVLVSVLFLGIFLVIMAINY